VALKAEKIKAPKNEGNLVSMPNQVSYDNVPFISDLEHLGLSVGKDEVSTSNALIELTKAIQSGAGEAKKYDKQRDVWKKYDKQRDVWKKITRKRV
jgi:hypothetical protein